MKLIGSYPSPFVRRIRMLLHHIDYEFVPIDIFSNDGRKILDTYGPVAKIPIFEHDNNVIWDSLQIALYLKNKTLVDFSLSLEESKHIIAINELTDSGVLLFQLKKFQLDMEWKNAFSQNQLRRVKNVFSWFENLPPLSWSIPGQWLYCTLDWLKFRQIYLWENDYPNLRKFYQGQQQRIEVIDTAPEKIS